MREKPAVADSEILKRLNAEFVLFAQTAEFLPIGADGNAWAYRVDTDETSYFLKMRRGVPAEAMLVVPDYLQANTVTEVVAPLRTQSDKLYVTLGDYSLILYPMIDGESAWEKELSDDQMHTWGDIMRRIHSAILIPALEKIVPKEQYISKHDALFKRMNRIIHQDTFDNDIANALADVWKSRINDIQFVYNRHLALGDRIKRQNLKHVICHADSHQANLMLKSNGELRVVDWDEVVIAPKERDLMFFDMSNPDSHHGFWAGYQSTDVNYAAIAYYRYEWVVQEFAEWAAWILDSPDRPVGEKAYALSEFKKLFNAGDVVEVAHQAFERA